MAGRFYSYTRKIIDLHTLMSSHAICALWHDDFLKILFLLSDIQRVWKCTISLETCEPGRIAQSLTCLTDASLTADPGVVSSIPAQSHTFVEIVHEIISTVI